MHSCLRATACSALVPGRPSGGVPRRVKHSPPGHTHSLSAAVWSGGRKVGARPILQGHGKVPLLPSVEPSERIKSEEHTSELTSLLRISSAVFCLKQKQRTRTPNR